MSTSSKYEAKQSRDMHRLHDAMLLLKLLKLLLMMLMIMMMMCMRIRLCRWRRRWTSVDAYVDNVVEVW